MIPLARQIACVERELKMRRRVYARWVQDGRMPQAKADSEMAEMEAVLATLQALPEAAPAQGSMLG
jgi:membrane carboxypeptidase/penicillin-binding protein PbpC